MIELTYYAPHYTGEDVESFAVLADGRETGVPGLVITRNIQVYATEVVEEQGWMIVHSESGLPLNTNPIRTIALATIVAEGLGALADWTEPKEILEVQAGLPEQVDSVIENETIREARKREAADG